MEFWYLDWCPRPTNSVKTRVRSQTVSTEDLKEVFGDGAPRRDVEYACRNDGLLLFSVDWTGTSCADDVSKRLVASHRLAYWIKQNEGHVHYFNKKIREYESHHHFPTIAVGPIEVDVDSVPRPAKVECIEDDEFLVRLDATDLHESGAKRACALLLLRAQYVNTFNKAKEARELIRQASFSFGCLELGRVGPWGPIRVPPFSVKRISVTGGQSPLTWR